MRALKIGLLVYPGCMPAGLFSAADVFQAVNRRIGRTMFEPVWLGTGRQPVAMPGGSLLSLPHNLEHNLEHSPPHSQAPRCDAYLLPGFWAESAADLDAMLERQQHLLDWLRGLPKQTALWSYCMGVALLAQAGRIDRRRATATWWLEQPLRQRFTAVDWDFQPPMIAHEQVITAAGANGHWALIQQVLASRLPAEILRDVELAMFIPRPMHTHPAFRPVELLAQADRRLQAVIAYAQSVPATRLDLNSAAQHLAVSSRTLSRMVDQATGMGAGEWLRLIKLRQAGHALLCSNAPVRRICEEFGFADEASLMRAFKRVTGMTTSAYRQSYGRGSSTAN